MLAAPHHHPRKNTRLGLIDVIQVTVRLGPTISRSVSGPTRCSRLVSMPSAPARRLAAVMRTVNGPCTCS